MKRLFPAIFHKEGTGYWVEFPDLPGCYTEGDSVSNSYEMAEEVLSLFLYQLQVDGTSVPTPSSPDNVEIKQGDFASLVQPRLIDVVDDEDGRRSVRTNVTLPKWLKEEAERFKINFSAELQSALFRKLGYMSRSEPKT